MDLGLQKNKTDYWHVMVGAPPINSFLLLRTKCRLFKDCLAFLITQKKKKKYLDWTLTYHHPLNNTIINQK